MPGPVPKQPQERRRRNAPTRGEWKPAPGIGWQHGPVPSPPSGLREASRKAWAVWFAAWFAAHWTPGDVPGLLQIIRLYDATERGKLERASELRQWMDDYGITPSGQQARRWLRPVEREQPSEATPEPYAHLRAVK